MLHDERGQAFQIMVVLIAISIFITIYAWWQTRPQEKISILDASFEKKELAPGQSTILTVKIKNKSDTLNASDVSVVITPSDPHISVGDGTLVIPAFASGEERSPKFSIAIAPEALEGKYKIEVRTSAESPFKGDTKDIYITVKA